MTEFDTASEMTELGTVSEMTESDSSSGLSGYDLSGFQRWFERYRGAEAKDWTRLDCLIHDVESDILDSEQIGNRVSDLLAQLPTIRGFCEVCQALLGHWLHDGRVLKRLTKNNVIYSKTPLGSKKCNVRESDALRCLNVQLVRGNWINKVTHRGRLRRSP
jgi:hypothetical protein